MLRNLLAEPGESFDAGGEFAVELRFFESSDEFPDARAGGDAEGEDVAAGGEGDGAEFVRGQAQQLLLGEFVGAEATAAAEAVETMEGEEGGEMIVAKKAFQRAGLHFGKLGELHVIGDEILNMFN